MPEKLKILLNLIYENKSIYEISNIMHLSYQELHTYLNQLKDDGYKIMSEYYSNGNIKYYMADAIFNDYRYRIVTAPHEDEIKFMVYSDLHLGSYNEAPELLDKIYDYSIQKGIHLHLNIGDLLEGVNCPLNMRIPWNEQVSHALQMYPFSEDILVFLLLGNHDYSLLENYGFDVSIPIKRQRSDIIPMGYGESKLFLKNDFIVLQHPLLNSDVSAMGDYASKVILRGHSHEMKYLFDHNNFHIYVPTLSNLIFNHTEFPGALCLKLKMYNGFIKAVEVEFLSYINKKFTQMGKMVFYTGNTKKPKDNLIFNEGECPKVLRKGS